MNGPMTFRDIATGETFHFNRNAESGLLDDLDKPGRDKFRKLSARTYECIEASTTRFKVGERSQVGSITAKVWADE